MFFAKGAETDADGVSSPRKSAGIQKERTSIEDKLPGEFQRLGTKIDNPRLPSLIRRFVFLEHPEAMFEINVRRRDAGDFSLPAAGEGERMNVGAKRNVLDRAQDETPLLSSEGAVTGQLFGFEKVSDGAPGNELLFDGPVEGLA